MRAQPSVCRSLPTYSIVLETENLAVTEMAGLKASMDSLANQSPSPADANEVLIVDSGDADPQVLELLQNEYPWIKVIAAAPGTNYYAAKMEGARHATGEIVLYVDSDCIYGEDWIRSILAPFAEYPDLNILGGETAVAGKGPYSLAMSIGWFFDGFSSSDELYPSSTYYFNNVAMRRRFLLDHSLNVGLPLYRGHCAEHAQRLEDDGIRIWRQPRARARHAPPAGVTNFIWRFLLIGHDNAMLRTVVPGPAYRAARRRRGDRWSKLARRLRNSLRSQPSRAVWLPLALPIVLIAQALVQVGDIVSQNRPRYLVNKYNQLQETAAP